jgi:serine/threonine protein phosphatase PrpC
MPRVAHCSEIGSGRENEDAFAVLDHPIDPTCLLCAVADGQGGQPRGGPAARLACQVCLDIAARTPPDRLLLPEVWAGILADVDQAVADDPSAGLTTVVGLCVTGDQVAGASNGDSAAVVACAGRPTRTLTERQFKNPPVGSGMVTAIGFSAALARPWTVLVMTDGVWKYAGWDKARACAEAGQGAAILDTLRDAVRLRSGVFPDDFTLVVVQSD